MSARDSLFGLVRLTIVVIASAAAIGPVGCAGNKTKKAVELSEADVGDRVSVAGMLTARGSTPHTMLVLESADGDMVVIQSRELQGELRMLSGMRVSIEGKLMPWVDGESPLVDAQRYELLALPSGEVPLLGVVRVQDGQCVLEAKDGELYWIRGEFVDVLTGYAGAKVWVVGSVGDAALPENPKGSVPMRVTGYGILSSP